MGSRLFSCRLRFWNQIRYTLLVLSFHPPAVATFLLPFTVLKLCSIRRLKDLSNVFSSRDFSLTVYGFETIITDWSRQFPLRSLSRDFSLTVYGFETLYQTYLPRLNTFSCRDFSLTVYGFETRLIVKALHLSSVRSCRDFSLTVYGFETDHASFSVSIPAIWSSRDFSLTVYGFETFQSCRMNTILLHTRSRLFSYRLRFWNTFFKSQTVPAA